MVVAYDPAVRAAKELEQRAEVDSLAALHQERRVVLQTLTKLRAEHGSFGSWDHRRKQLVESLKIKALDRDPADPPLLKETEKIIEAWAYSHPTYKAFLDRGAAERIEWITQENYLTEIEERIRSREIEIMAYSAETRLR